MASRPLIASSSGLSASTAAFLGRGAGDASAVTTADNSQHQSHRLQRHPSTTTVATAAASVVPVPQPAASERVRVRPQRLLPDTVYAKDTRIGATAITPAAAARALFPDHPYHLPPPSMTSTAAAANRGRGGDGKSRPALGGRGAANAHARRQEAPSSHALSSSLRVQGTSSIVAADDPSASATPSVLLSGTQRPPPEQEAPRRAQSAGAGARGRRGTKQRTTGAAAAAGVSSVVAAATAAAAKRAASAGAGGRSRHPAATPPATPRTPLHTQAHSLVTSSNVTPAGAFVGAMGGRVLVPPPPSSTAAALLAVFVASRRCPHCAKALQISVDMRAVTAARAARQTMTTTTTIAPLEGARSRRRGTGTEAEGNDDDDYDTKEEAEFEEYEAAAEEVLPVALSFDQPEDAPSATSSVAMFTQADVRLLKAVALQAALSAHLRAGFEKACHPPCTTTSTTSTAGKKDHPKEAAAVAVHSDLLEDGAKGWDLFAGVGSSTTTSGVVTLEDALLVLSMNRLAAEGAHEGDGGCDGDGAGGGDGAERGGEGGDDYSRTTTRRTDWRVRLLNSTFRYVDGSSTTTTFDTAPAGCPLVPLRCALRCPSTGAACGAVLVGAAAMAQHQGTAIVPPQFNNTHSAPQHTTPAAGSSTGHGHGHHPASQPPHAQSSSSFIPLCPHRLLRCPNSASGCEQRLPASAMAAHLEACALAPQWCPHCRNHACGRRHTRRPKARQSPSVASDEGISSSSKSIFDACCAHLAKQMMQRQQVQRNGASVCNGLNAGEEEEADGMKSGGVIGASSRGIAELLRAAALAYCSDEGHGQHGQHGHTNHLTLDYCTFTTAATSTTAAASLSNVLHLVGPYPADGGPSAAAGTTSASQGVPGAEEEKEDAITATATTATTPALSAAVDEKVLQQLLSQYKACVTTAPAPRIATAGAGGHHPSHLDLLRTAVQTLVCVETQRLPAPTTLFTAAEDAVGTTTNLLPVAHATETVTVEELRPLEVFALPVDQGGDGEGEGGAEGGEMAASLSATMLSGTFSLQQQLSRSIRASKADRPARPSHDVLYASVRSFATGDGRVLGHTERLSPTDLATYSPLDRSLAAVPSPLTAPLSSGAPRSNRGSPSASIKTGGGRGARQGGTDTTTAALAASASFSGGGNRDAFEDGGHRSGATTPRSARGIPALSRNKTSRAEGSLSGPSVIRSGHAVVTITAAPHVRLAHPASSAQPPPQAGISTTPRGGTGPRSADQHHPLRELFELRSEEPQTRANGWFPRGSPEGREHERQCPHRPVLCPLVAAQLVATITATGRSSELFGAGVFASFNSLFPFHSTTNTSALLPALLSCPLCAERLHRHVQYDASLAALLLLNTVAASPSAAVDAARLVCEVLRLCTLEASRVADHTAAALGALHAALAALAPMWLHTARGQPTVAASSVKKSISFDDLLAAFCGGCAAGVGAALMGQAFASCPVVALRFIEAVTGTSGASVAAEGRVLAALVEGSVRGVVTGALAAAAAISAYTLPPCTASAARRSGGGAGTVALYTDPLPLDGQGQQRPTQSDAGDVEIGSGSISPPVAAGLGVLPPPQPLSAVVPRRRGPPLVSPSLLEGELAEEHVLAEGSHHNDSTTPAPTQKATEEEALSCTHTVDTTATTAVREVSWPRETPSALDVDVRAAVAWADMLLADIQRCRRWAHDTRFTLYDHLWRRSDGGGDDAADERVMTAGPLEGTGSPMPTPRQAAPMPSPARGATVASSNASAAPEVLHETAHAPSASHGPNPPPTRAALAARHAVSELRLTARSYDRHLQARTAEATELLYSGVFGDYVSLAACAGDNGPGPTAEATPKDGLETVGVEAIDQGEGERPVPPHTSSHSPSRPGPPDDDAAAALRLATRLQEVVVLWGHLSPVLRAVAWQRTTVPQYDRD